MGASAHGGTVLVRHGDRSERTTKNPHENRKIRDSRRGQKAYDAVSGTERTRLAQSTWPRGHDSVVSLRRIPQGRTGASGDARADPPFEQRGIAVVTTAGTLVTLLFGLAAFSTATGAHVGHEERIWLAVALVLFLLCAGFALAPSFPVAYQSIDVPGFLPILNAQPEYDEPDAAHAVAELRAEIVASSKKRPRSRERCCLRRFCLSSSRSLV